MPWWFSLKTTGGSIREDRIVLPIGPGTHWSDAKPLILPAEEIASGGHLSSDASSYSRPSREKAFEDKRPPEGMPRQLQRPQFAVPTTVEAPKPEKPKRVAKPKVKNDPKLVAAARELRDRWLEQVNASAIAAVIGSGGKYEVTRAIGGSVTLGGAALPIARSGSHSVNDPIAIANASVKPLPAT